MDKKTLRKIEIRGAELIGVLVIIWFVTNWIIPFIFNSDSDLGLAATYALGFVLVISACDFILRFIVKVTTKGG